MWHSQSTKAKTSPYNIKSYPGPIPWSVKGQKKELQVSAFVFFPRDFGMLKKKDKKIVLKYE